MACGVSFPTSLRGVRAVTCSSSQHAPEENGELRSVPGQLVRWAIKWLLRASWLGSPEHSPRAAAFMPFYDIPKKYTKCLLSCCC